MACLVGISGDVFVAKKMIECKIVDRLLKRLITDLKKPVAHEEVIQLATALLSNVTQHEEAVKQLLQLNVEEDSLLRGFYFSKLLDIFFQYGKPLSDGSDPTRFIATVFGNITKVKICK